MPDSILLHLFLLFLFVPAIHSNQPGRPETASWLEMDNYHLALAEIYHPAEEGDLKPLKEQIDNLVNAAEEWENSEIPDIYQTEPIRQNLKKLIRETKSLGKKVKTRQNDDALLIVLLTRLHDRFHKVENLCFKRL